MVTTQTSDLQFCWTGEKNRELKLYLPCECGCDSREGRKGWGYLSGSDKEGNGFTLWITDADVYLKLKQLLADKEFKP